MQGVYFKVSLAVVQLLVQALPKDYIFMNNQKYTGNKIKQKTVSTKDLTVSNYTYKSYTFYIHR